jgi:hypothetical protein
VLDIQAVVLVLVIFQNKKLRRHSLLQQSQKYLKNVNYSMLNFCIKTGYNRIAGNIDSRMIYYLSHSSKIDCTGTTEGQKSLPLVFTKRKDFTFDGWNYALLNSVMTKSSIFHLLINLNNVGILSSGFGR